MRLPRLILVVSLTVAVAPPAFAADLTAKGKAIAATYCGSCHAIGPIGESPHPDAPPFREIVGHLSLDNLDEIFSDAVESHAQMAHVALSHGQLAALARYLSTMK
jgi:cytochrome c